MENNPDKLWRNQELKDTDWICAVTDHPERAQTLIYRQALRDWPSSEHFPGEQPVNEPPMEIPDISNQPIVVDESPSEEGE